MSSDTNTIQERLREKRLAAGLTQQRLAELTGVKRGVVNAYEHGRNQPNLEWLSKFVLICGTSYDYIVDGQTATVNEVQEPQEHYGTPSLRHLLEEISPELGVTDACSGPVLFEK